MLQLDELVKTYRKRGRHVRAVDGVSLQVEAGEVVAVQGPSGSGKTTLLLMAGALLHPTSGNVRIDGVDPYQLSANQRSAFRAQNVGFVFQQFHLVPYLTVLQNVLVAQVAKKIDDPRGRAEELIERYGLSQRVDHTPAELSVGERQRVALARAVFNKPKLLLADEPTGNLDRENAAIVLDSLRQYAQEGAAVLVVTHDPEIAKRADRIVGMEAGRLADLCPQP